MAPRPADALGAASWPAYILHLDNEVSICVVQEGISTTIAVKGFGGGEDRYTAASSHWVRKPSVFLSQVVPNQAIVQLSTRNNRQIYFLITVDPSQPAIQPISGSPRFLTLPSIYVLRAMQPIDPPRQLAPSLSNPPFRILPSPYDPTPGIAGVRDFSATSSSFPTESISKATRFAIRANLDPTLHDGITRVRPTTAPAPQPPRPARRGTAAPAASRISGVTYAGSTKARHAPACSTLVGTAGHETHTLSDAAAVAVRRPQPLGGATQAPPYTTTTAAALSMNAASATAGAGSVFGGAAGFAPAPGRSYAGGAASALPVHSAYHPAGWASSVTPSPGFYSSDSVVVSSRNAAGRGGYAADAAGGGAAAVPPGAVYQGYGGSYGTYDGTFMGSPGGAESAGYWSAGGAGESGAHVEARA